MTQSSRTPRIAYFVSLYPAVSHTFIQREILGLRKRGMEIETFTVRRADPKTVLSETDKSEFHRTVAILPTSVGRLVAAHAVACLRRPGVYLRTLCESWQIGRWNLRASLYQLFYFAESMILLRECRKRKITHLHVHFTDVAADVARYVAQYTRTTRLPITWSFSLHGSTEFFNLEKYHLDKKAQSASFVICIGEFARSQLMYATRPEDWSKYRIVHCGVTPASRRHDYASHDGPFRVLSVGRMDPVKLQNVLIDAIAMVRDSGVDVALTILGDGKMRAALEDQVRKHDLDRVVTMPGSVSLDEVYEQLAISDAFCLNSAMEGIPVSAMEAMTMGLPCALSAVAGVPELATDGVHALHVSPGSARELADAITALANDEELRRRLGEAAQVRIAESFNIERSCDDIKATFDELVMNRHDSTPDSQLSQIVRQVSPRH